jgi:hypothetical protein
MDGASDPVPVAPDFAGGDGQRVAREIVDRRPREGGDPSPYASLSASGQQASRARVGPGLRRGDGILRNAGLPPSGFPAHRPKKTPGGGPASGAFHRARSVLRPRSSGLGGRNRQGRVDPGIADPRNAARSPGKKKHPRGCGRIVPVLWPASQIFVRPAHERLSVRRAPAAVPARISFRKAPPGPWNSFPGTHIPGTSPVPGALSAR